MASPPRYNAGPVLVRIARLMLLVYFRVVHRVQFRGTEHVPEAGPVVVISNHPSYYDPPLLSLAIGREIRFMAWDRLFRVPGLGWLIRQFGAFPVHTERPGKETVVRSVAVLHEGYMLGVFPEGGRSFSPGVERMSPGGVRLARRAGAAILPITISGAYFCWPRTRLLPRPGKISVTYHPPIPSVPPQSAASGPEKQWYLDLTDRVRHTILAELQRRVCQRTGRYL